MNQIANESEFRTAVNALDAGQQRLVGAQFANNVLSLSDDQRINHALAVAADPAAGAEAIAAAFKAAKNAALEAHARCGADGEWRDQAGYFVARAAEACVAGQALSAGKPPAWKAAMSARMARTALAEEADEDTHDREREQQYRILSDYLNSL